MDHYDRWLKQDMAYIITEQEKTAFKTLTTDLEREKFVERFWRRAGNLSPSSPAGT